MYYNFEDSQKPQFEEKRFIVDIDYDLSLKELVDSVSPRNQIMGDIWYLEEYKQEAGEIAIELINYKPSSFYPKTDLSVLEDLARYEYRAATIRELIALYHQHPDVLNEEISIVALGDLIARKGEWSYNSYKGLEKKEFFECRPLLCHEGVMWSIKFASCYHVGFGPSCKFAAVRI